MKLRLFRRKAAGSKPTKGKGKGKGNGKTSRSQVSNLKKTELESRNPADDEDCFPADDSVFMKARLQRMEENRKQAEEEAAAAAEKEKAEEESERDIDEMSTSKKQVDEITGDVDVSPQASRDQPNSPLTAASGASGSANNLDDATDKMEDIPLDEDDANAVDTDGVVGSEDSIPVIASPQGAHLRNTLRDDPDTAKETVATPQLLKTGLFCGCI